MTRNDCLKSMTRTERIVLILIILLALVLRVVLINTREITYDDAFSYFLSRQSIAQIVSGTAADTMPPLYYFFLHFWQQIDSSVWFLRLLSVIFSLGCLFSLFEISRMLFSVRAALIATFLASISPLQIYHAQDIRMYSLMTFYN